MSTSELQRAQDMLTAMQAQRDQALNANVVASAEIATTRRHIAELQKQLAEMDIELKAAHAARDEAVGKLADRESADLQEAQEATS